MVNLNLPQWIWIYCGEFEIASVNLNLQLWFWIYHGEFEIYGDPQVSRQNFKFFPQSQYFIVWSKILSICLITAKLSSSLQNFLPRENFLTKTKLPFSWQTFKSKASLSFWWQNFFTTAKIFMQSVYNLQGAPLGEDDGGGGPTLL